MGTVRAVWRDDLAWALVALPTLLAAIMAGVLVLAEQVPDAAFGLGMAGLGLLGADLARRWRRVEAQG